MGWLGIANVTKGAGAGFVIRLPEIKGRRKCGTGVISPIIRLVTVRSRRKGRVFRMIKGPPLLIIPVAGLLMLQMTAARIQEFAAIEKIVER